jgi:hypothetical protein
MNPAKAIVRYEFLEVVVRIAREKFLSQEA